MNSETPFADFSNSAKPRIDKHIKETFRWQKALAKTQNAPYGELISELAILISRGGKRLRPLLCLLAYEAYGGRKKGAALQLAISLELAHAFLLIHDDIIDRDRHRWRGPNITGIYFERFNAMMPPREALHVAESWALLAGDACMAMANEAVATSGFDAKVVQQAQQLLQQTVFEVIGGELADVAQSLGDKLPTEAQILAMYSTKTASYSFRLPLQLGALSAGASSKELQILAAIAENLGIAFQLSDDLLGMFGNERQTGKPITSDLREGKQTLLINKALSLAKPTARRELLSLLGKENTSEADLQRAQTIIIDCGAQALIIQESQDYVMRALNDINRSAMNAVAKARLIDLAQSLTTRSK